MSEQSLADRATAERAAEISYTTRGMMPVNWEAHLRDLTKGGRDA